MRHERRPGACNSTCESARGKWGGSDGQMSQKTRKKSNLPTSRAERWPKRERFWCFVRSEVSTVGNTPSDLQQDSQSQLAPAPPLVALNHHPRRNRAPQARRCSSYFYLTPHILHLAEQLWPVPRSVDTLSFDIVFRRLDVAADDALDSKLPASPPVVSIRFRPSWPSYRPRSPNTELYASSR